MGEVAKIYSALDAVNAELQSIAKSQSGYQYKFRGIDQVLNTLGPLFKKHKIVTRREHLSFERREREVVQFDRATKLPLTIATRTSDIDEKSTDEKSSDVDEANVKRTYDKVRKDINYEKVTKVFTEVTMKCDYIFVSLEDGSELRTQGFGEGQDTSGGDKACSMATSNSYKYVIFEMFNIATEEQKDSDQVTAELASKEKAKEAGQDFRKKGKKNVSI